MNTAKTDLQCYAIRRVNPFLGVLQIIKNSSGRAISANGVVWDIEVSADENDWTSLAQTNENDVYIRYGLWSAEEGLVSRPLNPHGADDPLTDKCLSVIQAIQSNLENIPFKLQDTRELWLFDSDTLTPLALLAAMRPQDRPVSPEPRYWSSCLGADGVSSQYRFAESRELEQQVKARAGFNIKKYWLQRQPDGSALKEATEERIPAELIPPFLIAQQWENPLERKRAQAYMEWIAPSLLTLQMINAEQRLKLEQKLNVQAVSVEHHWRLYPKIIQQKYIKSARIQCQLQAQK